MASGHHAARPQHLRHNTDPGARQRLVGFLTARLTDELGQIWARDEARPGTVSRPGLAAQVAVLDELLSTLRSGSLPHRRELRILLYGYGLHPDYDPAWICLLEDERH